jgi:Tol biopolymer transport system component
MKRTRTLATTLPLMLILLFGTGAEATFPGSNGDIAFGRSGDVWVVDADGDTSRITDTRRREGLVDWNAEGTMLAFLRCGIGKFSNCDIWSMNADGGGQTRLTTTEVAQETWPTWSPDGTQIAFTSNELDDFQDIWVMDADGSDPTRLTSTIGFDAFPEWSPDGTKIVFDSDRSAIDDIWVIDADGGNPTRLTAGPKVDEYPDWSPDGAKITFTRNGNIWVMDADGSDETQLTFLRRHEFASTFSPNGMRIAFNREGRDDRFGIWTMPADGSAPARQRTFGLFDFFPDWQPVPDLI